MIVQASMIDPTIQQQLNSLMDIQGRVVALEENDFNGLSSRVSDLQSSVTMQQGIYQAIDIRLGMVELNGATKSYVDARFNVLIGTAPSNLDTLQEISAQLASDESAVAGIISTLGTRAAQSDLSSLASRVATTEGNIVSINSSASSLASRVTAAESAATSLASRVTANETDVSSLKTWRASKSPASADVTTTYHVPTAVITLGLNAPTSAGVDAAINTVMGEVNGIKAILRSREILAA